MDNTLLLNEKTNKILNRIERCKGSNNNIFLLNLWKNYILNKKTAYLQTLEDCENFLNETENDSESNQVHTNQIQYETILLLHCLYNTMNT